MGIEGKIKALAFECGFSFCGIARAEPLEHLRPFYDDFIARGGYAGFSYLKDHAEKRLNPELVFRGARSVIALLMNYFPVQIIPTEDNFTISKYAYGLQYQRIMRERMQTVVNFIRAEHPGADAKAFVDSGPVLEKAWGQRCGVGWQGKNTLLISKTAGSFFFAGIIFTNLELAPDVPETDHCGDCRRCVDACPTGALHTPYQLDIRRCISYYTIEKKEEMPAFIANKLDGRIYGCDACQDVCPYNRFAQPGTLPEFSPSPELLAMRKPGWLGLTPESFKAIFAGTPLERTGFTKMTANMQACQNAENSD